MESIAAYFTSNPEAFALFVILSVVMILYFILSKFIKLTIAAIVVFFIVGGINVFSDPAPMPVAMGKTADILIAGGKSLGNRLGDFWRDSKEMAGEAKKMPGEVNDLLDAPVNYGNNNNQGDVKKK
jgi:hypothetical protein